MQKNCVSPSFLLGLMNSDKMLVHYGQHFAQFSLLVSSLLSNYIMPRAHLSSNDECQHLLLLKMKPTTSTKLFNLSCFDSDVIIMLSLNSNSSFDNIVVAQIRSIKHVKILVGMQKRRTRIRF